MSGENSGSIIKLSQSEEELPERVGEVEVGEDVEVLPEELSGDENEEEGSKKAISTRKAST
jgi:hypothetical protein